VTSANGVTPLHLACESDHTGVVKVLLEKGVCVNVTSASGQTPLHVACSRGHIDTTKLLLEKGARARYHKRLLRGVL
jgi:ankyrin repeat protein